MKNVNVLGYNSNFEGMPAIAAARILAKVAAGILAIDESAWGFLESACLPPVTLPGKHAGEDFRVRQHRSISFAAPASALPPERSTTLATGASRDAIGTLLASREWVVGAINFDEDLHFSSYYLRQSARAFVPTEYREYAYSTVLAINEDFNETYYIPREDCERVGGALLEKLRAEPSWLDHILTAIRERALALRAMFPDEGDDSTGPLTFEQCSLPELLTIYRRHNALHNRLYEVARIPEALDRGAGGFTRYLKQYLQACLGAAASIRDVNRHFETLTFPEEVSAPFHELEDFQELLAEIKRNTAARAAFARSANRAVLQLAPDIRRRIAAHRNRWSHLGYHGYGSRALPDIQHYVNRISDGLRDHTGDTQRTPARYRDLLEKSEAARQRAFQELGVDSTHQHLFRLHSRVGIAKLNRRHIQLRNFYFLDALLAECARRLAVPEGVLRCLLPEELDGILVQGEDVADTFRARATSGLLLYCIDRDTEYLLSGPDWRWAVEELRRRTRAPARQGDRLQGDSASGGVARGRARILIRPNDATAAHFRSGDIIVSESTDADLRDLMARAGGVVTEAGGATCHAAIVCRELGIPALVGVNNALGVIRNDDVLVVNADEGYLRVVARSLNSVVIDDFRAWSADESLAGAKARSLSELLQQGFVVPRFFVVPVTAIRDVLAGPSDASGPTARALLDDVTDALEYLRGALFVIRSSLKGENGAEQSGAGLYRSESMVERRDVPSVLIDLATDMLAASDSPLRGGFIVQEMVLGDVSGVCFTADPRPGKSRDEILIEAVPGGNEDLTGGRVTPARYVLRRSTGELLPEAAGGDWRNLLSREMLRRLVGECLKIEDLRAGKGQDVEWCTKGDDIFVLQARPITGPLSRHAQAPVGTAPVANRPRKIAAVYRAYRVPPNLQMHLLRAAAVGALICDNWVGPPLDRHDVVVTLLLHDIGNIVKADYEQFTHLFPEEWQNLAYWKAVQAAVRERFGDRDQEVALKMAEELGTTPRILDLLRRKQFVMNRETLAASDWELKVCAYSDQRVSPLGVRPLTDRLYEAKARYVNIPRASVNDPRFDELVACAQEIERELAPRVRIALETLTEESIAPLLDPLREYTLDVPPALSADDTRQLT